ncbi:MAG: putative Ig domain-containing protein, partial [bacterium]|nr:putative Ig domain-containing protein [bacterium]
AVEGLNCGEISSDVTVDKSAPTTATVGNQFDYTLTVRNLGQYSATNVVVTDTLPAGVSFVSADTTYTFVGNVYTFNLGTLAPNGQRIIKLRVQAAEARCVTNVVTVASSPYSPDANANNNRDEVRTCISEPPLFICSAGYATEVVSYVPGTTRSGGAIPANRQVSGNALGAPQNQDVASPINFVSLGFGNGSSTGVIVLKFAQLIVPNPLGPDLTIVETTSGYSYAQYPEQAQVFVSLDGVTWYATVPATAQSDENVELPNNLPAYQYVKLVDVSNINFNFPGAASTVDGFDLDGVAACATQPLPTLTVVKVVDNTAGGTAQVSDFPLFVNGNRVTSGQAVSYLPGSYTVTETSLPNYTARFSESCPNGQITLNPGQNAVCTLTNTYVAPQPTTGTLEIRKDVYPGPSSTDFIFEIRPNDLGSDAVVIETGILVGDGESASRVLNAGSYEVAELFEGGFGSGFAFGGAICTIDGSDVASIPATTSTLNSATFVSNVPVQVGKTTICTFTNNQRSTIYAAKETLPDGSSEVFDFTVTGPGTDRLLENIGDGQTSQGQGVIERAAGTYTVAEVPVAGWVIDSIVCEDDANNVIPTTPAENGVTFDLDWGQVVTCTFTNRQEAGTLEIRKDENPDGNQDFNYEVRQGDTVIDDGTFSEAAPVSLPLPAGEYDVEEVFEGGFGTGYQFGGAVCTLDGETVASIPADNTGNATTVSSVPVEDGKTTICTFTNHDRPSLTIFKQTTPDGSDVEFAFTYSDNLPDIGPVSLADGEFAQFFSLSEGQYSVTESVTSGWVLSNVTCQIGDEAFTNVEVVGSTLTLNLAWGEDVTCTFNNAEERVENGTVIVTKQVQWNGAPAFDAEFTICLNGTGEPLCQTQTITAGMPSDTFTFENVPPGAYTVSETDPGANWEVSYTSASITVEEGETDDDAVVRNSFIRRTLTVTKDVTGNGAPADTFTICVDGPGYAEPDCRQFTDGDSEDFDVRVGTYTITEDFPGAEWEVTEPADVVVGGEQTQYEATVINAYNPPPPTTGTLVIRKATNPDGLTGSFTFDPGTGFAAQEPNFNLDANGQPKVFSDLTPGSYSVSEIAQSGWNLESASCRVNGQLIQSSLNGSTLTVSVAAGQEVECTFTNAPTVNPCEALVGQALIDYMEQYLTGTIQVMGGHTYATGVVHNNGPLSCDFPVGLAAYVMYDTVIDNQELYDEDPMDYPGEIIRYIPIPANGNSQTLRVDLPTCAAQVDLFYGELLPSLNGQRYGTRLLAWVQTNRAPWRKPFCVRQTNVAPVVTNPGDQSGTEGVAFSLQIAATDTTALTYSASGLPGGLSIDATSGAISGTPDAGTANSYSVTVTVTDAATPPLSSSVTFTLNIAAPAPVVVNTAPTVDAIADQSSTVGTAIAALTVSAQDAEGDTLSYSAAGLPNGILLDANTGEFSGTPTADGSFSVTVTVSDGVLFASTPAFTWTVAAAPVPNTAPSVTAPSDQVSTNGATIDAAANITASAIDAEGDSITFSAEGLPNGLSIDPNTGTISGTISNAVNADEAQRGYSVTIFATDGEGAVGQATFSWTVNNADPGLTNPGTGDPLTLTSTVGEVLNLQLAASDLEAGSLSFSADVLPAGVVLDAGTGLLSGTVSDASGTSFVVTITVTDAAGKTAQVVFTWNLTPAP